MKNNQHISYKFCVPNFQFPFVLSPKYATFAV